MPAKFHKILCCGFRGFYPTQKGFVANKSMSGIVVIENQNVKITERQTDIRQNLMRKVHLSLEPNKCLTLHVYTLSL